MPGTTLFVYFKVYEEVRYKTYVVYKNCKGTRYCICWTGSVLYIRANTMRQGLVFNVHFDCFA